MIVNVSSSKTFEPIPLLSIYRASKAAVNALTESAALELAQFGIRARVVVPGAAPTTSFSNLADMQQHAASGEMTIPQDVAEAVFHAATDPDCPMILPAGADAIALSESR